MVRQNPCGHTEFSFGSSTVVHAKGGQVADLVMTLIVVSSFLGPTSTLVEMNGNGAQPAMVGGDYVSTL